MRGPIPIPSSHSTRFRNETDQALTLDSLFMVMGTRLSNRRRSVGLNLQRQFLRRGEKYRLHPASRFRDGGSPFLSLTAPQGERDERATSTADRLGSGVKNQFFTRHPHAKCSGGGDYRARGPVSPGPDGDRQGVGHHRGGAICRADHRARRDRNN